MDLEQAHLQHLPPTKTSSFVGCEGRRGPFFPIAWHRRPSGRGAISSALRPEGEGRRGLGLHRAAAFPRCRGTSPPAVLPSPDGKGHPQLCARWPVPLPPGLSFTPSPTSAPALASGTAPRPAAPRVALVLPSARQGPSPRVGPFSWPRLTRPETAPGCDTDLAEGSRQQVC